MKNGNCWCKYCTLLQHRSIFIAFEIPRSYFRFDQFIYCYTYTCRAPDWNSRKKSMSKMLSAFLFRFFVACALICALSTCEFRIAAWQWMNEEKNFSLPATAQTTIRWLQRISESFSKLFRSKWKLHVRTAHNNAFWIGDGVCRLSLFI